MKVFLTTANHILAHDDVIDQWLELMLINQANQPYTVQTMPRVFIAPSGTTWTRVVPPLKEDLTILEQEEPQEVEVIEKENGTVLTEFEAETTESAASSTNSDFGTGSDSTSSESSSSSGGDGGGGD